MIREAEEHAEQDRKRRELQEARNAGDNAVYTAEKLLREYGDRIPENVKRETQAKIDAVKNVIQSDDTERIRREVDALMQQVQALGASMYQQTGEATGDGRSTGGEDVVEGEVVE